MELGRASDEANEYQLAINAVIQAMVGTLEKASYEVRREHLLKGGARPDLVAMGPDGRMIVVEVKMGKGRTHFSQIAQVESYASGLGGGTSSVTPILVTNLDVPEKIKDAATVVGVGIVETSGSDEDAAKALLQYLDAYSV